MDRIANVYVASDHNGNAARAYVLRCLSRSDGRFSGFDLGPLEAEGKVDYPDFALRVASAVLGDPGSFGVLVCGTGTGMCIAANKVPGIRAGLATDRATAELMREHNDCNVLVLGQWRSSLSQMDEMLEAFLTTRYGRGRHDSRLKKLEEIEGL